MTLLLRRLAFAQDPVAASPALRVESLYARLAAGDLDGLLAALSDSVAWDHDPGTGALPVACTLLGRDAVAAALRGPLGHAFGGAEVLRVVGCGPEAAALVETSPAGQGRLELHLWTFGEDGLVTRLRRVTARAADLGAH